MSSAGEGQGVGAHGAGGAGAGTGGKGKSKAARRREAKRHAELERQERVRQVEAARAGQTPKEVEEKAIAEQLEGMGLRIREVSADGHCMFRAVALQVKQRDPATTLSHKALRSAAVAHMRERADEYAPFYAPEREEESFEAYLDKMEGTAEWGGQLELRALAEVLRAPIKVLSAHSPPLTVGEHGGAADPYVLCHHRHYLTLGQHYNSVKPLA